MNADQPRPIHNEAELTEAEKHKTLKKVVFSSFLGNFIEWFDYASYSYLATVIALVFFPGEDKMVSTMMTFGVFALAFLVRPLGAIFWGNMGDKKGRKWALSISILMMSGATFLIGCLPGYAVIGVGAPLLLLLMRMVQSFSASGEYAGAATFIAEYSPKNHRGFYCSMVPASTAVGLLVGSLFATWMFNTFGASSDFVVNWGWRIPFWLAGPLGYITHYIREHLEDSPVYAKMQAELAEKGMKSEDKPIRTLFKKHFRVLAISFGACVLNAVGFYAVLTYLPNYLEATLNYDPAQASIITTIVLVVYIGFIFLVSTAAILAIQQLSQTSDSAPRYRTLWKLGCDRAMINRSLLFQVLVYFLVPLGLAVCHSVCAIGVLSDSLLDAIGVSSVGPIMMAAGLTLVIYGGYMLVTYLAARGIVKGSLQQG